MDKLQIKCSIPMIKSAISIGGDTASQVKFEFPESEIAKVLRLVSYTEKVLVMTIEIAEDDLTDIWRE